MPFVPVMPRPPDCSLSLGCRAESSVRRLTFLWAHQARGRHGLPPRCEANLSHRWGPTANMFPGPGRLFPCDLPAGAWGQRGPVEAIGEGGQTSFPRKCSQRQTSQVSHAAEAATAMMVQSGRGTCHLQPPPFVQGLVSPQEKGHQCRASPRALWRCFPAGWVPSVRAAERLAGPWGQDNADFLLQSDLVEFHSSRGQPCLEFSGMTLLFSELRPCTEITADSGVPHKKSEF